MLDKETSAAQSELHSRDYIGYSGNYPHKCWPNQAKIAINFVLNYEEGAEQNILDGDNASEAYLTDLPGITSLEGQRQLSSESMFEYGSRAGVWRLLNLFKEYNLPLTIFASGMALLRNPDVAKELANSQHEIAGHGYRWINYRDMPVTEEREHIATTLAIIDRQCHKKVYGWYTGRKSENTRRLIIDAGLSYDSEAYNDDLPYWIKTNNKPHLVIPYSLDTNDARYAITPGFNNGYDFLNYLKLYFDCLYREGSESPKMMTIGLHPRISGRPGRCEALRRFVEYALSYSQVWICRRDEIFKHWHDTFPLK